MHPNQQDSFFQALLVENILTFHVTLNINLRYIEFLRQKSVWPSLDEPITFDTTPPSVEVKNYCSVEIIKQRETRQDNKTNIKKYTNTDLAFLHKHMLVNARVYADGCVSE